MLTRARPSRARQEDRLGPLAEHTAKPGPQLTVGVQPPAADPAGPQPGAAVFVAHRHLDDVGETRHLLPGCAVAEGADARLTAVVLAGTDDAPAAQAGAAVTAVAGQLHRALGNRPVVNLAGVVRPAS